MSSKEKKIKYGNKDVLSKDTFKPSNVKRRISLMVDVDVLDQFKEEANKRGLPYQTLINQALRSMAFGEANFVPLREDERPITKAELSEAFEDPDSTFVKKLKKSLHNNR